MTQIAGPFERPFRGSPATVAFRDADAPKEEKSYRIVPFFWSPEAERGRLAVLQLYVIAAIGWSVYVAMEQPPELSPLTHEKMFVIAGVLVALYFAVEIWVRIACMDLRVVEITPREVRVLSLFGWRRYSRQMPLRFELEIHWELRRAQARGRGKPARHLTDSYHVVLRYAHQAIRIADIHGEVEARALLDRLNGCFLMTAPGAESAALHDTRRQFTGSAEDLGEDLGDADF